MGSQLVKQAFKDYKQDSQLPPQPFNEESLADDCLIDLMFGKLFNQMSVSQQVEWDTVFLHSNIQSNPKSVDEQFMKKMLKHIVQEDSMAGFATSEHTIKLLQESSYSTYFKVFTNQDTIDFTRLQQKKFMVLYGLYLSKGEKQGATEEQTFFQFVEKFLAENISCENQRSIVGLNTGLRFSLSILKELYKIRSDILLSSLSQLYQALCESPPGSIFGIDQVGFQQDQTLNEARTFLVSLIEDKETQQNLSQVAAKIIVRLGIVRSNPEDFLVLIEVLNRNKSLAAQIDLREEIRFLPKVAANQIGVVSSNSQQDNQVSLVEVMGVLKSSFIFFKATDKSHNISLKNNTVCSWACDGQNLYYAGFDGKLIKIGIPKHPYETLYIKESSEVSGLDKNFAMCFIKDRLLVRSSGEKPIKVFNTETLLEDQKLTDEINLSKDENEINLNFQEKADPKTGRWLTASPLFSDGNFVYVVSQKKYIAPPDADEDHQSLPTALVVEQYDPTHLKHLKSITLFKNELHEYFVHKQSAGSDEYFDKFVLKSTWHTNGEKLLVCFENKRYLFSMQTGVRIMKHSLQDSQHYELVIHDVVNSRFFLVQSSDEDVQYLLDFKLDNSFKSQTAQASDQTVTSHDSLIDQLKSQYLNDEIIQKPQNIFQKLMRETQLEVRQKTPLAENAPQLLNVLLLDHIKSNCDVFEDSLKKIKSENKARQENYLSLFRFKGATYLTATFFRSLANLLQQLSYLISSEKTDATVSEQLQYLSLLQILSSNLKALSYCGIQLPEIMSSETYQAFLSAYNTNIVQLIEKGYTKSFKGSLATLLEQVWTQIYRICQGILTDSMQLIYSDTDQIVTNLVDILVQPELSEKQAENCSFSLQYLTSPQNVTKLLKAQDPQQKKNLLILLEKLALLKTKKSVNTVKLYSIQDSQSQHQTDNLFEAACEQFIEQISRQALTFSETLNQSLQKKVQKSEEAKTKRLAEEEQFKFALTLLTHVFEMMTQKTCLEIRQVAEHITSTLEGLSKEEQNEEFAKKFQIYSNKITNLILSPQQTKILNLYVAAMPILCTEQFNLSSVIMKNSILIVQEIQNLLSVLKENQTQLQGKQEPEDSDEEKEQDDYRLKKLLNHLVRRVSWLVGYVSFGLIQIKTVEPTIEESKKETQQQKMERMLMDSQLLSGGLENRYVDTFSLETKQKIADILLLVQDDSLSKLLNDGSKNNSSEDGIFLDVMTKGKNEQCDLLIKVLQYCFEMQVPVVNYARQGGEDGLRLTRAAFAVMTKYSQMGQKLENMINEIDLQESSLEINLDERNKLKDLRDALRNEPDFKELLKQWNHAGRMRLWISEKKKNLSEKIERACRDKYIKDLTENKKKNKAEQTGNSDQKASTEVLEQSEGESKTVQEIQIDTMDQPVVDQPKDKSQETKPQDENQKEEEEEEEVKLTEQDKEKLQQIVDTQFEKELNIIYEKIIEKAEYLIKMQVPTAYLQLSKDKSFVRMISAPHQVAEEQELVNKLDWKERLKHWKIMRQDQGSIKSDARLKSEILDSGSMSVLACLQSPISVKKIQQRVESEFLKASRRLAGLKLLSQLIKLPLDELTSNDLVNWFTSSLRDKTNKLTHYLSNITGCGNYLESQIREQFFSIIKSIIQKIKASRSKQQIIRFLDALRWQFLGRDHGVLIELQIFKVLRVGDGERKHPIRFAWGKAPTSELVSADAEPNDLTKEILITFENLYFNLISRTVDSDLGTSMQLKTSGTSIPALERSKSLISVGQTENLIGSAFDIMFKELDRFVQLFNKFKGIDYYTFVRYSNKVKSYTNQNKDIEDLTKKFTEEVLLDIHLEDEEYKNQKKKSKEKESEEKENKMNGAEEDDQAIELQDPANSNEQETDQQQEEEKQNTQISEDQSQQIEDVSAFDDEAKSKALVEENPCEQEDKQDDQDIKQAETEEREQKINEANDFTQNQIKMMIECQFQQIQRLYSSAYLTRLLRMIEIFTQVAQTQAHPMAMVQRVANPYVLSTLINLFVCTQPRNQLIVLKIIQSLILISIPSEVFETAIQMLTKNEKVKEKLEYLSQIKFSSKFIDFWFKVLLEIRSAMWDANKVQNDDSYEVSQEISNLINQIVKAGKNYQSRWSDDIKSTLAKALLSVEVLNQAERDALFSLQIGSDFQRISVGSQVVTASNQLLTVLGYADKDQESSLKVNSNYTSEKQEVLGLYYDDQSKERQEIIRVLPYNLKTVYGLSQSDVLELANQSALLQPDVLKHMIALLVSDKTNNELRLQILKSVTGLFTILQKQFLSLLEQIDCLSPIIKFLLKAQNIEQKTSNTIVPITWLEAKATNIRVAALENDVSLNLESSLSAQILNNKQLIITSNDIKQNSRFAQSAFLNSAINLHLLEQGQQYQCKFDLLQKTPTQANIRQGFVFLQNEAVKKLDDFVLGIMKSAFAVVTYDVQVRELFLEIVAKARSQIESDANQGQDWAQILNCAVLVIAKEDFDELSSNFNTCPVTVQNNDSVSEIDFLIKQLQDFGGFQTQNILYHISQLQDKSIQNIQGNLAEILKKVLEEQKQNEETLVKLKSEKQSIQIEQTRLLKQASDRQEKIEKAFSDDNQLQLTQVKSVIDLLVEKSESSTLDIEFDFDIFKNQKEGDFKDFNKIIADEFVALKELASAKSAKSEEAMSKLYLKELNDFKLVTIAADYQRVIEILLRSYYKNTLLQILSNCDLSILMPSIVSTHATSKQLACYFKSSFNQAWLTENQTGQKTEKQTVKKLLRKVIKFCLDSNNNLLQMFVHKFLQDDVLEAGKKTLESLKTVKLKSVNDYFAQENTAIEYLHPNFMVLIVKILLECRFKVLLESNTYLPALFVCASTMFVAFWNSQNARSQMQLLEQCLQITFFVQEYIDIFVKSQVVTRIINFSFLKDIVRQIDYTQQSFSEVQKLLLEVYLAIISLKEMAEEKLGKKLDSCLEMTLGICQAKRALKIVKEKQSFQFLKYFIHESKLQDHDRQLMNQSFGTLNPHFDVKTVAKYSIDEVQRIQIKAHESCEFKPYTFLGLSQSPTGEDMKYYTKEELKENGGVIDLNYSQFYTFYPVKKQLLIGMGEQKHCRMSNITINDVPKVIPIEVVPVKISISKNSTFVLSKDQQLYSVGEKWGNSHQEFTKMALPNNEIPSQIFCGPRQKFVIAKSGKVFYVGEPTEFELPNNSTVSSFKEFKLPGDQNNSENIVDIACGNKYNLFVTNKGRLLATGKQFLKRLGMDSENAVPIHISNEAGLQVCRVWASESAEEQVALIQVKNSQGNISYYSVGKNEQGLLGQGAKIKEAKQFGKLAVDFSKIQFVDVSLYANHAVAIDQDGLLWSWGSNIFCEAGLSEDIDYVFQPTRIAAFDQLNLQAIRVSCGFDHTLVLAKNKINGKVQLYSIGKDENNFKTLGVTQQVAGEGLIRLIQHFQDFDIVDFQASKKFNIVILRGDDNPTDELHDHRLPDGSIAKGVLHAYKQNGKWQFMAQSEYNKNGGANLPDFSIAFRCPIENLEEVFNGSESIFQFKDPQLNKSADSNQHINQLSTVSEKPIQSQVAYFAHTVINGDQVHVSLSEDEFLKSYTQYDVHPLIYFRLRRPLNEGASLPIIDLEKIYKTTTKFGFRFQVTPNLTFIENKKLIQQTQSEYDEFVELSKKFPIQGDSELIIQMSRYLEKQTTFDILKDDAEKIFKPSEFQFKPDGYLHKVSEQQIKQRVLLYWHFNRSFVQAFPYLLNTPPRGFKGQKIANTSAANLFQEVKSMILTSVKMKFVDNAIQNLSEFGDRHEVTISRNDALRFSESGKVDHTGEHSIFGQILQQLKASSVKFEPWKQNSVDGQALRVEFDGESSIDAGGPYRETLTNMAVEIESGVLPMMIKSPNNRNNHGDNRDCFVVNQNSKTPTHEEMFKFLGVLIAYAFRSKSCMPFNFAPVFWKQLVGEELNESDLKSFDTYSWQIIQDLRKHAKNIKGKEEFEQIVDQQFTTTLNCSQEIELCENGRSKQVNQTNVEEFIKLMVTARFAEGQQQIRWIQEGMAFIVPKSIVNILTWEEVEIRAAGSKTTDVEKLKSITEYRNCTESSKVVKLFWNVMSRMSEEDKTLYLKFVWGRQRLPQDCSDLRYKHRIALIDYWDKEALPESHTCFFAIDIPNYESEEILEKKLLTSIRFCGEIDND